MDIGDMLIKIGKAKWFEKELLWYDVVYNVIGFNTRIHHSNLINNLPRFGTEFVILDIRTGRMYYAYMNTKQYQISSLKPLYDQYPNIEIGNIIRVAINPENNNEVWVDFKYQNEIDKNIENVANKEKNRIYNIFSQNLKRKDVEYRKLVKERTRFYDYNDTWITLNQYGKEEIEKRKVTTLESQNVDLQTKVTTLESQNVDLQTKVTTLESQNIDLQTKVTTLESQNIDLQTKVTKGAAITEQEAKEKTRDISFDRADILIEQILTKGFGRVEQLVEQKLLEVGRLRKLAEDDKTESIKNLTEAERVRQLTNEERSLIRGREEVELSIEKKLREIKEAETNIKKETEKYKAIFADNQKLMNDIRKYVEIPQNYKAWRLEVTGMGRKESIEDIQKRILDIGIETNMYEVDQTRKKRKDVT